MQLLHLNRNKAVVKAKDRFRVAWAGCERFSSETFPLWSNSIQYSGLMEDDLFPGSAHGVEVVP